MRLFWYSTQLRECPTRKWQPSLVSRQVPPQHVFRGQKKCSENTINVSARPFEIYERSRTKKMPMTGHELFFHCRNTCNRSSFVSGKMGSCARFRNIPMVKRTC